MTTTRSIVSLAVLAFPLLLTGCPVYGGGGAPISCVRVTDCPTNYTCTGTTCTRIGGCERDAQCAVDQVCGASGVCVTGARSCRVNGDCAMGSRCVANLCQSAPTCTNDAACTAAGDWCDARMTCVPRPQGACRNQGDCQGTTLCIEGFCRAEADTCQLDTSCGSGRVCLNNSCTAICTENSQCAGGQVCAPCATGTTCARYCRASANECTTSATCPQGQNCIDGRCLSDCRGGTACGNRTYCEQGDGFCRPTWQPGAFCTNDTQCVAGRSVCIDGACRTPCETLRTNAECMSIDAALPRCVEVTAGGRQRNLCVSANTVTSECRTQATCGASRDCVNGSCRNN